MVHNNAGEQICIFIFASLSDYFFRKDLLNHALLAFGLDNSVLWGLSHALQDV